MLASAGAVEAGPKTSGVAIIPLGDSRPVVAELVFTTRFHGECVKDAEHGVRLQSFPIGYSQDSPVYTALNTCTAEKGTPYG